MTPSEARTCVLEFKTVELPTIGRALGVGEGEFAGGASFKLVADILTLHENEDWPRTGQTSAVSESPYIPFSTRFVDERTAYRSFLPDDLKPADIEPLRALLAESRNPLVKARIAETIWLKFKDFKDADACVEARLDVARVVGEGVSWTETVRNLGKLASAILKFNMQRRFNEFCDACESIRTHLLNTDKRFSYFVLADVLGNTFLSQAKTRVVFGETRAERWRADLEAVAKEYRSDPHLGHEALLVLRAWDVLWSWTDRREVTSREVVDQLLSAAAAGEPKYAPMLIQSALSVALDFGIADLVERCRALLNRSLRVEASNYATISYSFELPDDSIAALDQILSTSESISLAIRKLAVGPSLLDIDLESERSRAEKNSQDTPFLKLIPVRWIHPEGRIIASSDASSSHLDRYLAICLHSRLSLVEGLLGYFLIQTRDRIQATTLMEALGKWPHLNIARIHPLSVAAERFARGDRVSSAFIVIPFFESLLRDLLRAAGYSATKIDPGGVQLDETLNSLLRTSLAKEILGEGFCKSAEYLLCDSSGGPNLRNEIAHGTVRHEALSEARVFLVWLHIVRLTCFSFPLTSA